MERAADGSIKFNAAKRKTQVAPAGINYDNLGG